MVSLLTRRDLLEIGMGEGLVVPSLSDILLVFIDILVASTFLSQPVNNLCLLLRRVSLLFICTPHGTATLRSHALRARVSANLLEANFALLLKSLDNDWPLVSCTPRPSLCVIGTA